MTILFKKIATYYIKSNRIFILENIHTGGYYIRPEDGYIVNPQTPFPYIPSLSEVKRIMEVANDYN